MKRDVLGALGVLVVVSLILGPGTPALAADDTQVKDATRQVDRGAHKIGKGEVGEGTKEMAKGIGNTVVEGAKFTGEKFKDAGRAAKPEAKRTGEGFRDGFVSFGHSVRDFFVRLFSIDKDK